MDQVEIKNHEMNLLLSGKANKLIERIQNPITYLILDLLWFGRRTVITFV